MRELHVYEADAQPRPLTVLGEAVTVFGLGDSAKPFEVHLQQGYRGGGPPPHHHPWDEAFYVLDGEVALTVDGDRRVLAKGAFVHIPAGVSHAYENLSEQARLLAVVSDPRGGEVFQAMHDHVQRLPEDLPRLAEINARYGVVFL